MVKKSNDIKQESEVKSKEKQDIFNIWANSYTEISKTWADSYEKLYRPWLEATKEMFDKTALLSKEATPQKYMEFYTLWVDTYKEIFEKYGKSTELSREMFENFIKATEIYLSMYKSWIAALEEMSQKAQELSKQSDPETYNKFYNLWVKTYEKAFESFFEDMPAVGYMKEIMEPLKIMTKMHTDTITRMSNTWMKPGVRSAPAYPGKNKKRGIQTA